MRLIRFYYQGKAHLGAWRDGGIVDLSADWAGRLPADVSALLRGEGGGLAIARAAVDGAVETIDPGQVILLAPVTPGQILCLGLNYRAHIDEAEMEEPDSPVIFTKSPGSLIGDGEAIRLPRQAPEQVDYEAELAFVIGRLARGVAREDALDYVAGYACANDVSARDVQFRTSQWSLGKMLDTFCPLGPALVTADEIADPNDLAIRCLLNGQVMQASTTADMIFDIPTIIEYLSGLMTLHPGDVVLTGTPLGVGFARQPPVFLQPGDIVEVQIEGVGRLRNPVAAAAGRV